MFRRVVVCLDGSPLGDAILPAVERLAADTPVELVLLTVVSPPSTLELATALHETVDKYGYAVPQLDEIAASREKELVAGDVARTEAALAAHVEALTARGLRVRPLVRVGVAAEEIARTADAVEADAIALSTHGRQGLDHLLHGSVAEALLRRADLPLLLLRPDPHAIARHAESPTPADPA
jgi:nucleotide-binding universal stress UspA family protein